jgi:GNAT superfamily N-acetyltransferase
VIDTMEEPRLRRSRNSAGFLRGGKSLVTRGARRRDVSTAVHVTWKETLLPDETDDTPVYEINANIWDGTIPRRIGYYQAYMLFPTEQCLDPRELYRVCDFHSQTLADFGEQLYGATANRLKQLLRGGELLFVHLIEVLPTWQGRGIGAAVFRTMLEEARDTFGATIAIFEPVPLQFESPFSREAADAETLRSYEAAVASIRRYYTRAFGARPLGRGRSYYYVRIPINA